MLHFKPIVKVYSCLLFFLASFLFNYVRNKLAECESGRTAALFSASTPPS